MTLMQEQGGFVYLFFGDKALPAEERSPIPWCPELDMPDWKAVYGECTVACTRQP